MKRANRIDRKGKSCHQSGFSALQAHILAAAILVLFAAISPATLVEHSIPNGMIEAVEVDGVTAYRIRVPLAVVSSQLRDARHFEAWLEFTAAATSERTGDISVYASETPFNENLDQVQTRFYKNKLVSSTEADRIRIEIASILIGALNEGYESVDIVMGQFANDSPGGVRVWPPGEGGKPWKMVLSVKGI